jgi:type II secretory pathway pseudopilin PulG
MTPDELVKLIEGLIVVSGVAAIVFAVFKNSTVKATIQSQKELIETLTTQVSELRTLHIDNEKAIAKLSGQVEVYKELPLTELANSMKSISETQSKILESISKLKIRNQTVHNQTVENERVVNKH